MNNTLPWALLIHLAFACWFLGTESLQSEVITETFSKAADYKTLIDGYHDSHGILVRDLWRRRLLIFFALGRTHFSKYR